MTDADFPPDPDRVALLRDVADEIRETGQGSESEQIAALLYRVSDLYDPAEETSPGDIYLNMRYILGVKEQGGIRRRGGSDPGVDH